MQRIRPGAPLARVRGVRPNPSIFAPNEQNFGNFRLIGAESKAAGGCEKNWNPSNQNLCEIVEGKLNNILNA